MKVWRSAGQLTDRRKKSKDGSLSELGYSLGEKQIKLRFKLVFRKNKIKIHTDLVCTLLRLISDQCLG